MKFMKKHCHKKTGLPKQTGFLKLLTNEILLGTKQHYTY
jgi:hypothetical protein